VGKSQFVIILYRFFDQNNWLIRLLRVDALGYQKNNILHSRWL